MNGALLIASAGALLIGAGIGYYMRQLVASQRASSVETRLKKLVEDARVEAKETLLDAKEKSAKVLEDAKNEERDRIKEIRRLEERLLERESSIDRSCSLIAAPAFAQNAEAGQDEAATQVDEIVVTGIRASLSAAAGTTSSLNTIFSRSAMGCSAPNGPTRFGPSLDWNRPSTRRSR